MIFKFFNKNDKIPDADVEAVNVACLLIHAAKIDENYTSEEKEIIKKTTNKLYPDLDNLDELKGCSNEDFKEIGIKSLGQRKRLLRAIKNL